MLVTKPIEVWTICPHHLLPCILKVTIGYVPDGSVLGLSKFSRIAEIMGKRPILQEEYSRELANFLEERLEPKGVAIYIVGKHNCMIARGVKQDVEVMIENGDVITFDKPTHIDQLEADIKSIQFVREPNRKLGVVKIEYQGLLGSIITNDNWFEKKKQSISVVDILHTHFYKTLGL